MVDSINTAPDGVNFVTLFHAFAGSSPQPRVPADVPDEWLDKACQRWHYVNGTRTARGNCWTLATDGTRKHCQRKWCCHANGGAGGWRKVPDAEPEEEPLLMNGHDMVVTAQTRVRQPDGTVGVVVQRPRKTAHNQQARRPACRWCQRGTVTRPEGKTPRVACALGYLPQETMSVNTVAVREPYCDRYGPDGFEWREGDGR